MNRQFDYNQKILVAVEFSEKPRQLTGLPPSHAVFRRIGIPEVTRAFDETQGLAVRLLGGTRFHRMLDEHMGYWEKRIPVGKSCFVHYAIGSEAEIAAASARLREAGGWVLCGVYHVEPQSSAYPFAFPTGVVPSHFHLGESHTFGKESVFWFNFFPDQPYLFEKTFPIWALFCLFEGRERGECNQLVALDAPERVQADGVDPFVQINLNRFSSLLGYFESARESGRHSFTLDKDYRWYGMLLHKV